MHFFNEEPKSVTTEPKIHTHIKVLIYDLLAMEVEKNKNK